MQIDKAQVIGFLKQRGDDAGVDQAERHLPEWVDTEQHAGLLAQHGISVEELLSNFGGRGEIL